MDDVEDDSQLRRGIPGVCTSHYKFLKANTGGSYTQDLWSAPDYQHSKLCVLSGLSRAIQVSKQEFCELSGRITTGRQLEDT